MEFTNKELFVLRVAVRDFKEKHPNVSPQVVELLHSRIHVQLEEQKK